MRIPSGDARHLAYAALVDGSEVTVVEVHNDSPVPVALAFALRPYTVEGPAHLDEIRLINVQDRSVHLGGGSTVLLPRPPNESGGSADTDLLDTLIAGDPLGWDRPGCGPIEGGIPNGVLLYPLPHRTSLRVAIVTPERAEVTQRSPRRFGPSRALAAPAPYSMTTGALLAPGEALSVDAAPEAEHVARGWTSVVESAATFVLPDPGVSDLVAAARSRLLLAAPTLGRDLADLRPGAGLVLEALAIGGHRREVARALAELASSFPARLRTDPASAAAVLDGVARAAELRGEAPSEDLLGTATQITSLIERAGRRRLGRRPEPEIARLGRVARLALADLARLAGDRIGAGRLDIDLRNEGPAWAEAGRSHEVLAALTAGVSPAGSWDDDSPTLAARFVLAARAATVLDRGSDLILLPDFPSAWRGGGAEVSGVPTRQGTLSFALRWHGPRPALLWQLDPFEDGGRRDEDPVRLRCPALDGEWWTEELRGEVLLAGSAVPLPSAPRPGDNFQ